MLKHWRGSLISVVAESALAVLTAVVSGCPQQLPPPAVPAPSATDSIDVEVSRLTSIRIRGATSISPSNEPLYVIDGVPYTNFATVANLNPRDIESVEILRGAAAASIYGLSAGNGVVIISTDKVKDVPDVTDFPSSRITYRLDGTIEVARLLVESLLREAHIRWSNEVDDPLLYVITWYMPEPAAEANQDRRVSVLLRLSGVTGNPSCSTIAISWLRQTKGEDESTYRDADKSEQQAEPAFVTTIMTLLDNTKLRRNCH